MLATKESSSKGVKGGIAKVSLEIIQPEADLAKLSGFFLRNYGASTCTCT